MSLNEYVTKERSRFEVHIVTDSYAGNFEREMFSFITGILDESEYSPELVDLALKEEGWTKYQTPFENIFDMIADEGNHSNYVSISSDGMMQKPPREMYLECNSVVLAPYKQLSLDNLHLIERRAKRFCENNKIGYNKTIMYKFSETGEEINVSMLKDAPN